MPQSRINRSSASSATISCAMCRRSKVRRARAATTKALPLASKTSVSSLLVWHLAHCSNCSSSTRVEVLNTCALAGSLPSTTAPAKVSGCTSSPTTRPLLFLMILLLRLVVMFHSLDARRDRLLTNSRYTQTSGAELPAKTLAHSMRVHPSDSLSLQSGKSPLHRSSPAGSSRVGPLLQVPSRHIRASGHASRRVHKTTFPQRTTDRRTASL